MYGNLINPGQGTRRDLIRHLNGQHCLTLHEFRNHQLYLDMNSLGKEIQQMGSQQQ